MIGLSVAERKLLYNILDSAVDSAENVDEAQKIAALLYNLQSENLALHPAANQKKGVMVEAS